MINNNLASSSFSFICLYVTLYFTILYAIFLYTSFPIILHSIFYVTPICRFSLHVLYPTLNVTGVPKNVAFHSVGLSTHILPGILQLV